MSMSLADQVRPCSEFEDAPSDGYCRQLSVYLRSRHPGRPGGGIWTSLGRTYTSLGGRASVTLGRAQYMICDEWLFRFRRLDARHNWLMQLVCPK